MDVIEKIRNCEFLDAEDLAEYLNELGVYFFYITDTAFFIAHDERFFKYDYSVEKLREFESEEEFIISLFAKPHFSKRGYARFKYSKHN